MELKHSENTGFSNNPEESQILTRAIIDTIHEPLIVLDEDLCVVIAGLSFYTKFNVTPEETVGKVFYELGDNQFNIPALRILLEKVIPEHSIVQNYEVDHFFKLLGLRTLHINAREIKYESGKKKMLLSIFDITDRRSLELEREKLIAQKDLLLIEMKHRIANSLQLIASILTLKAETVKSAESRLHLVDAQERIMSIATVQQQLDPIYKGENVSVAVYLQALVKSLSRSMIGNRKPITVHVVASPGNVSSDVAISFGLITTELVINAIKHAFPDGRTGVIIVEYEVDDSGWSLSVSDDGVGQTETVGGERPGLGTSIIGALANQLHATIRSQSSSSGMKVSLKHANL